MHINYTPYLTPFTWKICSSNIWQRSSHTYTFALKIGWGKHNIILGPNWNTIYIYSNRSRTLNTEKNCSSRTDVQTQISWWGNDHKRWTIVVWRWFCGSVAAYFSIIPRSFDVRSSKTILSRYYCMAGTGRYHTEINKIHPQIRAALD